MIIAFDVDDTLIIPSIVTGYDTDVPNYENIGILRWFQSQGHQIVVWSGGGVSYAEMWGRKLGLEPCSYIVKEKRDDIDIAFDDCDVDLGKVNVKVKRINNSVSRKDWNKHEK